MSYNNPEILHELTKLFDQPVLVPTEKWIRIYIGDILIAESYSPLLLIEDNGNQLTYFFDEKDVKKEFFIDSDFKGSRKLYKYWHVKVNDKQITNAAFSVSDKSSNEYRKLIGYIGFEWKAITKILEEDVELIGHPRNPFRRIDTRPTSRLIQIKIGDIIIAESKNCVALFETDFRVRYYVPMEDVLINFLYKSDTTFISPYKGVANYWSVRIGDNFYQDIVWSYLDPMTEALPVKGYFAFWKVDLYVNGKFSGNY